MKKFAFLAIGLTLGCTITLLYWRYHEKSKTSDPKNEKSFLIDTIFVKADTIIRTEKVFETIQMANADTVMVYTQFKLNEPVTSLPDTNDYIVLRDKILDSKTVPILHTKLNTSNDASDILAQKMSNDEWFGDKILVEFWESPIGYEGYRLNKTKLILFGVNPKDELSLTFVKQGYLLLHLGALKTKLYPTENFLTFGK